MRITDISVSRLHAMIKRTSKGYFYIQDNQSKFGSLALVKSPVSLNNNEVNYIQAGRTLLEMQIRYPINLLSNCFCVSSASRKIPVAPKNMLTGMTSKNGIDFFPEEFLAITNKCKKEEDNILIQDDLTENGIDTMRAINLKQHGIHREVDQEHENRNDNLILGRH